jgi:methionyl-tRNA formyltransferase
MRAGDPRSRLRLSQRWLPLSECAARPGHRRAAGRHSPRRSNETIWFDSVGAFARARGIETIAPADPRDPEVTDRVRRARPDFLFSFYYRSMLQPALLSIPGRGAFNSTAPSSPGTAAARRSTGRSSTANPRPVRRCTRWWKKPDAGRIVDQEAVPILPDDLAVDVFDKVTEAAARVMARSLPRLVDGSATLRAQDLSRGSYFGGRKPEDGRIDWKRSARDIHNLVRAVARPIPGPLPRSTAARCASCARGSLPADAPRRRRAFRCPMPVRRGRELLRRMRRRAVAVARRDGIRGQGFHRDRLSGTLRLAAPAAAHQRASMKRY